MTLPNSVDLKVDQVRPRRARRHRVGRHEAGHAGDGLTVNVPLFINEGDVLKIDTREGGKYLTRVAVG